MAIGPGKYDDVCTTVREETSAELAIVIVLGGKHGDGFSCQTHDPMALQRLPELLQAVAKQIDKDIQ